MDINSGKLKKIHGTREAQGGRYFSRSFEEVDFEVGIFFELQRKIVISIGIDTTCGLKLVATSSDK